MFVRPPTAASARPAPPPRAELPASGPPAQAAEVPLYTRYAAAPRPAHPVREPSFLHALLVAAWLGRVIDPLPHKGAPR